ncbi:MAG: Smr/MutS family protein [Prolixibacteraceae bacterium]|nr:Smr/MutS family protein [Prolixibacteraceae bacterium]
MQGTYPENFEIKTGFDKIRAMLAENCISTLGREWVENIRFSDDYGILNKLLSEVDEFVRILNEYDQFPISHFYDVRPALEKIRIEGRYIVEEDIWELKQSLETVRAIVNFFNKDKKEKFPLLSEKASFIQVFPYIYDRFDSILNKTGKIRDNASPELAQIRKDILVKQSGMSRRIQQILKKAQKDGLVDEDASIAIRDGRAVIPISSAKKRQLKGIVYDESATGKTAYIEPTEIVELNNEIRELEYAERREIIKILIEFANDIRPYIEELGASYEFLGEIDFIRAKARLAIKFEAIKPELTDSQEFIWENAIHPLLMLSLKKENRKIVPLNISLSEKDHILLISGPNAGGKSVCLKTVGLIQYMLQCGLLIPVREGSKTGIFNQIFIDIGDEQSIENDLSTYSSHLLNMKYFSANCNPKTLILIDEFGTGTEPMLGGAIAESILNKLNNTGTYGVITTHYTNLKHFAASAEGIVNGAMLYDSQNMNPLFQLEIGKPGSSFAFEIARKIGLPEDILQDATEKIGKKHIDFDKNLKNIVRDKRYWESKRQKIRKVEKILDDLAANYENELKETQRQRKEILKKANEEAEKLLAGVNKKIENTIQQIRKEQADKEKTKTIRDELEQLKKEVASGNIANDEKIRLKIDKLKEREKRRNERRPEEFKAETKVKAKEKPEGTLEHGDLVRLIGQETFGEIIQFNEKNVVVAFGQLMTTVPRSQIEKVGKKQANKTRNKTKANILENLSQKRLNFKPDIDIRGQRVEEAISNIQAFIDDAIMLEVKQLRILHGKGNGILKESIRDFLRAEPMVKNFKDEHVQFGGAGITVVNLSL